MNTPHRIETAGLTINLRLEGNGPPLLFLGGSSFDLSIKAPVFESQLLNHFTVAAYDPRGLGQSDAPDGEWTMADYAKDACNVLDALGWSDAFVLGESFGAMTALHLAVRAPKKIKQLALAAGTPGGDGGSSFPIHRFRDITDPRQRAKAALGVLDTRFNDALQANPHAQRDKIEARIVDEKHFLNSYQNAIGFPRLLKARATHDCWNALPSINIPTLIFSGDYDAQAPQPYAKAMSEALPDATFHGVAAGHNLCFATDAVTSALISRWSAPE